MEIKGVSAIVTGGASGIGAASVRLLAKGGAKVVIADLDRQQEVGEALAKEVGGAFCAVDVTNTDDIINAVEMAKSMGPLRVLVNSAGIGWAQRTIGKDGQYESAANIEAFKKVIAINLVGTFDAIRIAATAMSQTEPLEDGERGAIVNIAALLASHCQLLVTLLQVAFVSTQLLLVLSTHLSTDKAIKAKHSRHNFKRVFSSLRSLESQNNLHPWCLSVLLTAT
jgi:NAD(P)-dependent dehydrogenase (short-subunit alcohol dehydrogenase family)